MKTPFSNLKSAALIALVLSGAGSAARAGYINGQISFAGYATVNSVNLGTATKFVSVTDWVSPFAETGSYATPMIPWFTPVTFADFSWVGPFATSGLVSSPLWTFKVGTTTYSFQATSLHVYAQNANFLDLTGTGIASITGYTNTPGAFSITDTNSGGGGPIFTFGASSAVAAVPDHGGSAALVELGFAGLLAAFAARRQWIRA